MDIARHWEERALPVEEAKLVELKLAEPLRNLIEGIAINASAEEMLGLLDKVISAHLASFA